MDCNASIISRLQTFDLETISQLILRENVVFWAPEMKVKDLYLTNQQMQDIDTLFVLSFIVPVLAMTLSDSTGSTPTNSEISFLRDILVNNNIDTSALLGIKEDTIAFLDLLVRSVKSISIEEHPELNTPTAMQIPISARITQLVFEDCVFDNINIEESSLRTSLPGYFTFKNCTLNNLTISAGDAMKYLQVNMSRSRILTMSFDHTRGNIRFTDYVSIFKKLSGSELLTATGVLKLVHSNICMESIHSNLLFSAIAIDILSLYKICGSSVSKIPPQDLDFARSYIARLSASLPSKDIGVLRHKFVDILIPYCPTQAPFSLKSRKVLESLSGTFCNGVFINEVIFVPGHINQSRLEEVYFDTPLLYTYKSSLSVITSAYSMQTNDKNNNRELREVLSKYLSISEDIAVQDMDIDLEELTSGLSEIVGEEVAKKCIPVPYYNYLLHSFFHTLGGKESTASQSLATLLQNQTSFRLGPS